MSITKGSTIHGGDPMVIFVLFVYYVLQNTSPWCEIVFINKREMVYVTCSDFVSKSYDALSFFSILYSLASGKTANVLFNKIL